MHEVRYEPAESRSGMFGGNSNWRGPIWFPINYLLIEALERFHHYYGDTVRAEHPPGSGNELTLHEIAADLAERMTRIFLLDEHGRRPVFGDDERFARPGWRENPLFFEYFHGDTGAGLGASHQTGWTALVVRCLDTVAKSRALSSRGGEADEGSFVQSLSPDSPHVPHRRSLLAVARRDDNR